MKQTQYIVTLHQADDAPEPSLKDIERVLISEVHLYSRTGSTLIVHREGTSEWTEPIVIPPAPVTTFTLQSVTIVREDP